MTKNTRASIKNSLGKVVAKTSRTKSAVRKSVKIANSDDDKKVVQVRRAAPISDIDVNREIANDLPEIEDFEIDEDSAQNFHTSRRLRKKSVARKIWLLLCDLFLALCILMFAGAVYLASEAKKSGEAVEIAGFRPFLIATGSMEPTYSINGFVLTHNDNFADVKVGDVVAFRAESLKGQAALHRVIAKVGDGNSAKLYVKGDNNPQPDGAPVTRDNYIGRALFNTNLTAVYIGVLRGPNGFAKAVVLPLILLLLLYFGARLLIGSAGDWRTKGIAICVVIMIISAGILVSYTLYNFKQVDYTNSSLASIATDFAKSSTDKTWTVNGEKVIGRIEIPSLKLDYPIIEYQAATSLDTTIAEFSGAGVNVAGNEVLVGHRAFGDLEYFNLFFTNIDQLKIGDEIFLTGLDRERVKYVIKRTGIVAPNDNEILKPSAENVREVTLIATTYDLKNRYVVRAVAE